MFRQTLACVATLATLLAAAPSPAPACTRGPDPEGWAAVESAFRARSAVREHFDLVEQDEIGRALLLDPERRETTHDTAGAQVSLLYADQDVGGFELCDQAAWQDAELSQQELGFGVGFPVAKLVRVEGRIFGLSHSILQSDANSYRPAKGEPDVRLPGARGRGEGLWSLRLQLRDWASLTVGRVGTHDIRHSVGWDESYDDDGNFDGYEKSNTTHWGRANGARMFVAVGSPALGTGDIVFGSSGLDHLRLTGASFQLPAMLGSVRPILGWDGIRDAVVVGGESSIALRSGGPLWWRSRAVVLTRSPLFEEATTGLRLSGVAQAKQRAFEWGALELRSGVAGANDTSGVGARVVPTVSASAHATLPILALIHVGGWMGVNRPETVQMAPQAVGRFDYGFRFYATMAL